MNDTTVSYGADLAQVPISLSKDALAINLRTVQFIRG